jgi:Protein of unknown function (DUF1194)
MFRWLVLCLLISTRTASAGTVDLNLVIAIDCSFSVSSDEYELQMQGTAWALSEPEVVAAIQEGPIGRIAITVVQWSNDDSQVVVVPWREIGTLDEALAVASEVAGTPRSAEDGATSISRMIYFGLELLAGAPNAASREVIDIAGDGENNIGPDVQTARDTAVSRGVTINGLTILNAHSNLHSYYRRNVIGGSAPFVEIANDFSAYAEAIKSKLLREIRPPVS